jgi:rfaE bifunctional protein kinase chain/domain
MNKSNHQTIETIFNNFNQLNILIVGDVMVDTYLYGKVERISPEAPVPIVAINKKENRLGGAANVALNIQALGANPILCSVIGEDTNASIFLELLKTQKISTSGIIKSTESLTTVKTRVIGNNHQMLRIDEEIETDLKEADREKLGTVIENLFDSYKIDALIFEDYDKGTLSENLIMRLIAAAKKRNIPVAADPKKKNFKFYTGIDLFKPNLKELREGLKIEVNTNKIDSLHQAVQLLENDQNIKMSLITLSELGVYVKTPHEEHLIQAHIRNIADVSGAGDTVIAVATLALALNLSPVLLATLANLAGGLVCELLGAVPIDKQQLYQEAIQINNNAFDKI